MCLWGCRVIEINKFGSRESKKVAHYCSKSFALDDLPKNVNLTIRCSLLSKINKD